MSFVSNLEVDPEDSTYFELEAVVQALQRLECPAMIDHTGGGCATIFAGDSGFSVVCAGGPEPDHYAASAGPGWFDRQGKAWGSTSEFYVGPDDLQGDGGIEVKTSDVQAIAECIWGQVQRAYEGKVPTLRRTSTEAPRRLEEER